MGLLRLMIQYWRRKPKTNHSQPLLVLQRRQLANQTPQSVLTAIISLCKLGVFQHYRIYSGRRWFVTAYGKNVPVADITAGYNS